MKKDNSTETNKKENVVEKKSSATEATKITKVGAMLKEMRLQKGLKIAEISKQLCIRKHYIEAIEESDYKEIPAFPYGIGFIRSYANFLGLNGENIVELYKEETQGDKSKDIKVIEQQKEASIPEIRYLLVSVLAIAIIYAVWTFFNQKEASVTENSAEQTVISLDDSAIVVEEFNISEMAVENDENNINSSEDSQDEQIVVSEGVYGEKSDNNDEKLPAQMNNDNQERLESSIPSKGIFVEVLKETWVEVKDENKLYISKVLLAGDGYIVPEGKGKILSVGKHDGVNVYINGILTNVVKPNKKTNISLDKFLNTVQ